MSGVFIEAITSGDIAAVKEAPKADLHSHSYFGSRIERLERRLGHPLKRPPAKMDGLQGMEQYAAETLDPYLYSREGTEFTAQAAVDQAIEDGVVLLEMSFDIRSHRYHEGGLGGLVSYVEALAATHAEYVRLRPELGFSRTNASDGELVELAADAIASGAFKSIDLYSAQDACPPEAVATLYEKARSRDMVLKAHVGEFGGAEEVRRTVEVLGLDEVQHGIGAAESADVMAWLADNGIRLHVCPTSNVMLNAVADLAGHPIRVLYDHGVEVTVNTDDLMIFGQSVSDEYVNLYNAGVFSAQELDSIRKASIKERT